MRFAWDLAARDYGCRYLAVLDADTVVKPDWLIRMRALHRHKQEHNPLFLVTGYNSKAHTTLAREQDFCLKESLGGASLLFSVNMYDRLVRDALVENWDWRVVDAMRALHGTMLAVTPSVVQHLGVFGLHCNIFQQVECSFDYRAWWTPLMKFLYYLPYLKSRPILILSKLIGRLRR